MNKLSFLAATCFVSLSALSAAPKPAQMRHSEDFILNKVLKMTKQEKRADIPAPEVYYKSSTPLSQFQNAIENQWGSRPAIFLNGYAAQYNEIYLMDDAYAYKAMGRCAEAALAHEMVHYVQYQYRGRDIGRHHNEPEAKMIEKEYQEIYCD